MKLNLDLIHDILIAASASLSPDEDGVVTQISPYDLAKDELSNYPQNEVLYWMHQLLDSGILVAGSKYVDESMPHIKDLSLAGYQFIENTSKPAIWEKIRTQLLGMAISNLPDIIRYAIEAGSTHIS